MLVATIEQNLSTERKARIRAVTVPLAQKVAKAVAPAFARVGNVRRAPWCHATGAQVAACVALKCVPFAGWARCGLALRLRAAQDGRGVSAVGANVDGPSGAVDGQDRICLFGAAGCIVGRGGEVRVGFRRVGVCTSGDAGSAATPVGCSSSEYVEYSSSSRLKMG